jgi:hypothetical protein
MRTFVTAVAVVALAAHALSVQAQTAPPPAASPPAAAPPAAAAGVPQPNTKPVDCRAQAREKGLRGPAINDAVAICVAEQRLACTKEAVERKIATSQRREFLRTCAGRPGGGKEDKG